ncbi:MAG: acyltransferase [Lachnospiraceae bacterium]|nr:acyltransferase [Lachnospiraceae bacterium]
MAVYGFYLLLLLLLFGGSKVSAKGEWNDEYLSRSQTKAFLGFCTIVIMFHHISQKTCAPWLDPQYIRHGLEFFVYIGYPCVAMFFFCSGYGMYVASRKGDSFFDHYFIRRILPVIIPAALMWLVFFFIEQARGMMIDPPLWINVYDYIWYVPALLYIYIIFYICFHLVKNAWASFALLWVGVALYFILSAFFSPGTWWYNTQFMFAVGATVGAKTSAFTTLNKRHYPVWIVLSLLLTLSGFIAAGYYEEIVTHYGIAYDQTVYGYVQIAGQLVSALTFVWFVLLLGMKIRIGNRVLAFLGSFTLELYLVHPLFVHLFAFAFVQKESGPVYYIENQLIYIPAVILPALLVAYVLHYAITKIK